MSRQNEGHARGPQDTSAHDGNMGPLERWRTSLKRHSTTVVGAEIGEVGAGHYTAPMCFASAPSVPPVPPPPPDPPTDVDPGVKNARDQAKRKARAAQGYSSTVLTGPMGDQSTASTTSGKALLGA